MKLFLAGELRAAIACSMGGGQALHCHRFLTPNAPACFVRHVKNGGKIGHLFDQDEKRLRKTVRALGVRVIYIHHRGTPKQHVDLCGAPMNRAEIDAFCSIPQREIFSSDFEEKFNRRIMAAERIEESAGEET